MGFSVSERVIKLLCGKPSFEQGMAYYQSGRVELIDIEENNHSIPDQPLSRYVAAVQGRSRYEVTAVIDIDGDVNAECTCPIYYHGGPYCKHIAALLIHIHDLEHGGDELPGRTVPSSLHTQNRYANDIGVLTPRNHSVRDENLVNSILGMFGNSRPRPSGTGAFVDNRVPLSVEFICKPFTYSYNNTMLGIEMKVGPKRLYIVHKIRSFLERIHRGETFEFSKHFIYDSTFQSFRKEDNDILQKLIEILLNEKMYRDNIVSHTPYGGNLGGDRLLAIPPFFWETLQPVLAASSSVYWQHGEILFEGIPLSDEIPPLSFEFEQAEEEGYHLDIQGLDKITVLEDYELVLSEGKLIKLGSDECKRLAEIKKMLESSRREGIDITPEQMEPFMDKVIPGLKKLGQVHIAESIADRIVQAVVAYTSSSGSSCGIVWYRKSNSPSSSLII